MLYRVIQTKLLQEPVLAQCVVVVVGGHNGRTVAPEAILFESPCRANSETKMAKA